MIEWNSWKFRTIVVLIIGVAFIKFNQIVDMGNRKIVEEYLHEKYTDKTLYIKDEATYRKGGMYFIESKENKDNNFIVILNDKKVKDDTYKKDVESGKSTIYRLENEVSKILGKDFEFDINHTILGENFGGVGFRTEGKNFVALNGETLEIVANKDYDIRDLFEKYGILTYNKKVDVLNSKELADTILELKEKLAEKNLKFSSVSVTLNNAKNYEKISKGEIVKCRVENILYDDIDENLADKIEKLMVVSYYE